MSESHSSNTEAAAKALLDLNNGVVDIARKKKLPPPRYSPLRTMKRRNCGPEKSICKVQRDKYCVTKQPAGTHVRPRMFRTPQGNRCITGFRVCPNKNCYPSRWFSGKNNGSPQTAAYIRNYERIIQNPANRASILATLRRKQFLGPPAVRPSPRDPETIREGRESASGELHSPGRDGSLSDYDSNDSANYSDFDRSISESDINSDDDNDDDDDADANTDKAEDKDVVNDDDISTEKQKTKNKLKRNLKLKAQTLKKAAQAMVYYKNLISKFKRSKSFQEDDNKKLYADKLKDISDKLEDLKNSLESFKKTRLPSKKYNRKIKGRVDNKLNALATLKSELEETKRKDEAAKRKTRETRRLEREESPSSLTGGPSPAPGALPALPSPGALPALPSPGALPALPAPGALPAPSPDLRETDDDNENRDDDYENRDDERFDDQEESNDLSKIQRSLIEKAIQEIDNLRHEQTKLNSKISEDSKKKLQQMLETIDTIVNKFEKNKDPSKEEIESFDTNFKMNYETINEFILKQRKVADAVSNNLSTAHQKREEARAALAEKKAKEAKEAKEAQEKAQEKATRITQEAQSAASNNVSTAHQKKEEARAALAEKKAKKAQEKAEADKATADHTTESREPVGKSPIIQEESTQSRELAESPTELIKTRSFADRKNKETRDKNDARLLEEEASERFNRQTPFGKLLKENDKVFFEKGKAERLEAQKFRSIRKKFGSTNAALIASRKRALDATAKTKKAEKDTVQVAEGKSPRAQAEVAKEAKFIAQRSKFRDSSRSESSADSIRESDKSENTKTTVSDTNLSNSFKKLNIKGKSPLVQAEIKKFKDEILALVAKCYEVRFRIRHLSKKEDRPAVQAIQKEKDEILEDIQNRLKELDDIKQKGIEIDKEKIRRDFQKDYDRLLQLHDTLNQIIQKKYEDLGKTAKHTPLDSLQKLSTNTTVKYTDKALPKGEKHVMYARARDADEFVRFGREKRITDTVIKRDANYLLEHGQIDKKSRDNIHAAVEKLEETSSESSNSKKKTSSTAPISTAASTAASAQPRRSTRGKKSPQGPKTRSQYKKPKK